MNLAAKLPPTPVLLPALALAAAGVLLVVTVFVQGRALSDSAQLAKPAGVAPSRHNDAPLPASTSPAPSTPLASLATSELFGHYDPSAPDSGAEADKKPDGAGATLGDKAPDSLPDATLALHLQGIVFKQDPAQRRAIIAGDGPNAEARRIGETLLGDAVIRYIEARRVVVEQQGELKALRLPEALINTGAAPFTPGAMPPMPGSDPAPYVEQPMEPQYEAPPEDADLSVPDDGGGLEQSEPTE